VRERERDSSCACVRDRVRDSECVCGWVYACASLCICVGVDGDHRLPEVQCVGERVGIFVGLFVCL
jgi:hypothetical protein